MTNRPAVFLRVAASDGAWGWGEVFSNFPQVGAEHRARLVDSIFAPLLHGFAADEAAPVRAMLELRTRRMSIQCGEPGPFAQITGAVDQALWDMAHGAPRAAMETPGWRESGARVQRDRADRVDVIALARQRETTAFKLKVGFGATRDVANLAAMRAALGVTPRSCATPTRRGHRRTRRASRARAASPALDQEPIAADRPHAAWRALADVSDVPLAAGENLRGRTAFGKRSRRLSRVRAAGRRQWGSITGGLRLRAMQPRARALLSALAGRRRGPRRVDPPWPRRAMRAGSRSTPIPIPAARSYRSPSATVGHAAGRAGPGVGRTSRDSRDSS
jgi:L-alanine-DL-glutamate epimerase-like enolase superfamily enzyme